MTDQNSTPDEGALVVLPPDRWVTFTGLHREPSLYREIYTRTVSALIAAFVIYVVAALSGFVSTRPILVVFIVVGIFGTASFVLTLLDVIRYRKHVLPLFKGSGWSPAKTQDELVYRRIYTRLIFSFLATMFLVIPVISLVYG